MAFNMKRPVIKGTPLHKASIAKAKTDSIVAQTRTAGDPNLVEAGNALGRSYIPAAIDFSKDGLIDFGDVEDKKKDVKKVENKVEKKVEEEEVKKKVKKKVKVEEKNKVKKENRDKSGDKEATKIKSIKPGESKGKKGKGPDLKTRVAPYVEEAEDEDIIFDADTANEESDNSDSASGSTGSKAKPYENWKVRADKRNIAEAEAIKKRLDEASKKRTEVSPMEPKAVVELPNNTPDPKLKKAGTVPNAKEKPDADKNPDYAVNRPKLNAEGNPVDFGGSTNSPGYNYDANNDQWSYNGINIMEDEVSNEAYTAITRDIMRRDREETQERLKEEETNLNSNTPSRDSSSVDLLPQPPPAVNNEVATTTTRTREQKQNDKIYNDFRTSKYTKNKMIEEGYNPIKSKSPMEMRDDRVYANAKVDGPVRRNMIKGGYVPR
tara:strand:- start:221 stop:1528 length:1308 start_codon:yes stop_codon:yes gene_type:complete